MTRDTAILLSLLLGVAVSACTPAFHVRTPSGFVELDGGSYDYRATNAEGVVMSIRALPNEPEGDLRFWAGAVDARLRRRYAAESVHEIETSGGLRGVQVRYRTTEDGRAYRYWATIFVRGDTVFLLEAGGDDEFFDPRTPEIEAAIRSLDAG